MSSLVQKKNKSNLSGPQKKFNQLKNKILKLEKAFVKVEKELNDALSFYYQYLKPVELEKASVLSNCMKLMYAIYRNSKLKDHDKQTLKSLIVYKIREVYNIIPFNEQEIELIEIFKELAGFDIREQAKEETEEVKTEMTSYFKNMGVDIDLSTLDAEDNMEDIVAKFSEALSKSNFKENIQANKKKSIHDLKKEEKRKELERLQQEGISSIYKTLAKSLHPDLEQDFQLKVQKEALMKRLTVANEQNDLHALLSIELEWMTLSGSNQIKESSDEQLKIYNSILQEQVNDLNLKIQFIPDHLKYVPIARYLESEIPPMMAVQIGLSDSQSSIKEYSRVIKELKGEKWKTCLNMILSNFQTSILESLFEIEEMDYCDF